MASHLACAVSDIPENHALIDPDKTGIFFPVKDSEGINEALSRLVTNQKLRQSKVSLNTG